MLHKSLLGVCVPAVLLFAGSTYGGAVSAFFYGVTNQGTLLRYDMGAQSVTQVVNTSVNLWEDCDFDASGTLWGMRTGNAGGFPPTFVCQAYTINTSTGASTPQGNFGNGATLESLAFHSNNFYSVNASGGTTTGHLVFANMSAGTVSTVTGSPHGLPVNQVDALAFNPLSGALFGLWNSNAGGPFGTTNFKLVSFNQTTGAATIVGSITGTTDAFYALRFDSAGNAYTVDATNGDVYAVNLTSGAGTLLFHGGSTAAGTRGLALIPVPAPAGAALLGLGVLGFSRRRRS